MDTLLRVPSRHRMRKRTNLSREFPFLELNALEIYKRLDDFDGDTLSATYQSTASGANSNAAAINTGKANGEIRLDPGDANAGRCDLSLGLHFSGTRYAVAWWKATTPAAITSMKFELGFTDVISGTDAGAVNVKATPSFNADDAVVLCMDTTHNSTLQLMGVQATVAATPVSFATALAASTYYYFGVALLDTRAKGYLLDQDGKLIEETAWMENAVTAATLLTPWAFVQNRSGAQRVLDIDAVYAYQRRTATT